MGNYSSDPKTTLQSALDRGYTRVRFQQGKPILDRELNLVADLVSPERMAQQYLGDGVPAGSQGFQITGLNVGINDFNILPGRCLVGGREIILAVPTTYRTQPNNANVVPFPAGASNVYLRVFSTEIASAQDAGLNNIGDVGFETAIREKTDWEVLVSAAPINAPGHMLLAVIDTGANTVTDKRRVGLTLSALGDEITTARGNAATLDVRLKTADQTLAVVQGAVTAVQGEVATARGTAAQVGDRLNASLATDGTLKPGIVSISRMASTLVFNAQASVAAAAAAGQTAETDITVLAADEPAFLLISVHLDGPRPQIVQPWSFSLRWKHLVTIFHPPGAPPTSVVHLHQVVVENSSTTAFSVTCKAYRLIEG